MVKDILPGFFRENRPVLTGPATGAGAVLRCAAGGRAFFFFSFCFCKVQAGCFFEQLKGAVADQLRGQAGFPPGALRINACMQQPFQIKIMFFTEGSRALRSLFA